jgi:two-component system phosphate regulon sensor histidine kinase PhoR
LGGTGLGLAIVKHVVSRHRGYLQIESELGEGTAFTVYLPVA